MSAAITPPFVTWDEAKSQMDGPAYIAGYARWLVQRDYLAIQEMPKSNARNMAFTTLADQIFKAVAA